MQQRAKRFLAVFGIGVLAAFGTDAATYAGTGDSLIVGKFNKAAKTTHLTSTGTGPALSLHAKGKRPALAVDTDARVVRLNADRLDGRNASALQNNVRVYTATSGSSINGGMAFVLPDFPDGRYQVTYNVYMAGADGSASNPTTAVCHLYRVSGGGFAGFTSTTQVGLTSASMSGSDVLTKGSARWGIACGAQQVGVGGDEWYISSATPMRVTLTRIDKTIGGKLAAHRASPSRTDLHNDQGSIS